MKGANGSIREALNRIRPYKVRQTPLMPSPSYFKDQSGLKNIFFKCENRQRTGVFKYRGAVNALSQLPPQVSKVITHSSGNHALALSKAAREFGKEAHVVMPKNAPMIKKEIVADYGGQIEFCENSTVESREAKVNEVIDRLGGPESVHFIHPSNDLNVIQGQGTMALEILDEYEWVLNCAPDAILVPVGGGGLISGIALAVNEWKKEGSLGRKDPPLVIGCEPINVNDAWKSKQAGEFIPATSEKETIADGLRTSLGTYTYPIVCSDLVDSIFTVSEESIVRAMEDVYMRLKLVIEPSAGVGPAVLAGEEFQTYAREKGIEKIAIVLCGGNIDLSRFSDIFK